MVNMFQLCLNYECPHLGDVEIFALLIDHIS